MITFDFPPLTSEMAAWNDSHKSTGSDVCVHGSAAGVGNVKSKRWENPRDKHKEDKGEAEHDMLSVSEALRECRVFLRSESKWKRQTERDRKWLKEKETPTKQEKENTQRSEEPKGPKRQRTNICNLNRYCCSLFKVMVPNSEHFVMKFVNWKFSLFMKQTKTIPVIGYPLKNTDSTLQIIDYSNCITKSFYCEVLLYQQGASD